MLVLNTSINRYIQISTVRCLHIFRNAFFQEISFHKGVIKNIAYMNTAHNAGGLVSHLFASGSMFETTWCCGLPRARQRSHIPMDLFSQCTRRPSLFSFTLDDDAELVRDQHHRAAPVSHQLVDRIVDHHYLVLSHRAFAAVISLYTRVPRRDVPSGSVLPVDLT